MLTLQELRLSVETAKLHNEVKLIHFKREGSPLAVKLCFVAGSRFDITPGTAHFLEHLLVAGSKKYSSKDKLAAVIENYGGFFSANTGVEALSLNFAIGDPNNIAVISELLEEMVFNSLLDEKSIDTERGAILREFEDKQSDPKKKSAEMFRHLFFQGTSLDNSTLGTVNSIKKISKNDLLHFYQANILSGQAVLITTGDSNFDDIYKFFTPILQKLNSIPHLHSGLLDPSDHSPKIIQSLSGNDQTYFVYGFKTPPLIHSDQPALVVLSHLLGGGRSSFLMKELRYKKGLISGLNTSNNSLSDVGSWTIQTATRKDHLAEVLSIIRDQLELIKKNGVDISDLNLVKNKIIGSGLLALQTSESIVNFHAFKQFFYPHSVWTVENFTQEIENITTQDLQRTACQYFQNGYLAVLGDTDLTTVQY